MPKTRVNGLELYYELHNNSDTVVLFANGVLADTRSWAGQLQAFAEYTLLLFDFRGQGRSDKPEG